MLATAAMAVQMHGGCNGSAEVWQRGATPDVGQGQRLKGASKEWWLRGHRRAERSYSTFKVRRSSCEEMPRVQGKEQRLHFAGAAVKSNPRPR